MSDTTAPSPSPSSHPTRRGCSVTLMSRVLMAVSDGLLDQGLSDSITQMEFQPLIEFLAGLESRAQPLSEAELVERMARRAARQAAEDEEEEEDAGRGPMRSTAPRRSRDR